MLTTRKEIIEAVCNMGIGRYEINDDLSVDCYQGVYVRLEKDQKIPFKFNIVHGDFDFTHKNIDSFENFPKIVMGDLNIHHNKFTSLEGMPQVMGNINCSHNEIQSLEHVGIVKRGLDVSFNKLSSLNGLNQTHIDELDCSNNQLTTLDHCPQTVEQEFACAHNQLVSLRGGPKKVGGDYFAFGNYLTNLEHIALVNEEAVIDVSYNRLTSLEGVRNEKINNFLCNDNMLTSLKYCPKIVHNFDCFDNYLTDLEYCPKEVDFIECYNNNIRELKHFPSKINNTIILDKKEGEFNILKLSLFSKNADSNLVEKREYLPNKLSNLDFLDIITCSSNLNFNLHSENSNINFAKLIDFFDKNPKATINMQINKPLKKEWDNLGFEFHYQKDKTNNCTFVQLQHSDIEKNKILIEKQYLQYLVSQNTDKEEKKTRQKI